MAIPELQNYITQSRAAGIPDDQIRRSLVGQGWSVSDIDQAFGISGIGIDTVSAKSYTKIIVIVLLIVVVLPALIWGAILAFGYYKLTRNTNPTPSYVYTYSPTPTQVPLPVSSAIPTSTLKSTPKPVQTPKPQVSKTPTPTPVPTPAPTWHLVATYNNDSFIGNQRTYLPWFTIKGSQFHVIWSDSPKTTNGEAVGIDNFSFGIHRPSSTGGSVSTCGSTLTDYSRNKVFSGVQTCSQVGQFRLWVNTFNNFQFTVEDYY